MRTNVGYIYIHISKLILMLQESIITIYGQDYTNRSRRRKASANKRRIRVTLKWTISF